MVQKNLECNENNKTVYITKTCYVEETLENTLTTSDRSDLIDTNFKVVPTFENWKKWTQLWNWENK